jgi:hypothetical protein
MKKKLPRIESAQPILHGVLKVVFLDGYEGVLDLRPVIAKGGVFKWLQKSKNFDTVRVDEFGHGVGWTDATGYEIELSADSLRRDCERQAEIHKLMVV